MVKCQESGELLSWKELVIDHRQPNTFSVIVDRFIEVFKINISEIEYIAIEGAANEFADEGIKDNFREYHTRKANLRIIKKSLNSGRTHQARIKRQNKDLKIRN